MGVNKINNTELLNMLETESDYEVIVDNDSVWIENYDGEYVDSFDNFGYHLLVDVFNHFGIEARFC